MGVPAGPWYIDDLLTFTVNTHDVATGAGTDADAVPSYRVYEDETGTAILTGNMAKLDDSNTVGFYSEQLMLSAANGFEDGKSYSIYVAATVDSVAATQSFNFKVVAPLALEATAQSILADTALIGEPSNDTIADDIAAVAAAVSNVDINVGALEGYLTPDYGDVGPTGNDTTHVHIPTMIAGDDQWNNHLVRVTDLTDNSQYYRWVVDSVASTSLITITPALPFTPEEFDFVTIFPDRCDDIDWADGGRLDLILDARASQTSVDDLPTNAELATALGTADDAVLAAIAALNNLSAAQVNAEVDTALSDIHLDHLLAVTYDPASKPGAADALLNELVESDAGVSRFTANALEQAPTGGSAPTASEIADEVETRTIAAVTLVNGLAANSITASAVANDAVAEIQNGLATASDLAVTDDKIDAIKLKTDNLTFTVANQVDSNVQYVNDVQVTGTGAPGSEWGPA